MPYIKKIIIAGRTKEIIKIYSSRYGKRGITRGKNINATPEEVRRVNQRNAETKLRHLLNTNFGKNDIHMVLTYKKKERPDPEQGKKNLKNFIRRIKRVYDKKGIEFKYITVTEYKTAAIHHHLIVTGIDVRLIQDKWPFGKVRPTYMDDTGEYSKLANYLIKETSKTFNSEEKIFSRRYGRSRNLKQPKIITRIVKSKTFREDPKPEKGYYIEKDSIRNGVHEVTGRVYQFYRMIKIDRCW
jgi:hypothetical protein